MKHRAIPFGEGGFPGVDRNDPEAAETAISLQFPDTFSARAFKVIRYMEGTMFLFSYKGKFVVTDESLELTESGNGADDAPYGCPHWVGDSLEELEWWLETLADDYDSLGNIPGWEVSHGNRKGYFSPELMSHILITMSSDRNYFAFKTFDRLHGTKGRFLIGRDRMFTILNSSEGTACYESDCGDYAKITRLENSLQLCVAWLDYTNNGSIRGFRQDVTVPIRKIWLALFNSETIKHLYVPSTPQAIIDARPAADTIRKIAESKRIKRAFCKAMRDFFHWQGDTVTLFRDGGYSFFFTTMSGFPKSGGLILHEGEREGYPYIYYSVHT